MNFDLPGLERLREQHAVAELAPLLGASFEGVEQRALLGVRVPVELRQGEHRRRQWVSELVSEKGDVLGLGAPGLEIASIDVGLYRGHDRGVEAVSQQSCRTVLGFLL